MDTNNRQGMIDTINKFTTDFLNLTINIRNISKISENKCLVELDSMDDKLMVMRNKSKLLGKKYYIDNDLTKTEQNLQWKLRKLAKEKRNEGMTVAVKYRKLIVNGQEFRWNEREERLEEVIVPKN